MTNMGIDYGLGQSNIDHETGIRYGVISSHEIIQYWTDESEPIYSSPTCPKCGNEAWELDDTDHFQIDGKNVSIEDIEEWEHERHENSEFVCLPCKYIFGNESALPENPIAYKYEQNGYRIFQSYDDPDLFIELSPYYTYAQFCSPCAPGAVHLNVPLDPITKNLDKYGRPLENNKGFCLGHDWFESGKAPYRMFSVKTNKEVLPE